MEKYREKLKLQNWLYAIGAVILIAVQVLSFNQIIAPAAGDEHWHGMWNGFIAGASFGVTAVFLYGIFVNRRALRNEAKLKKLYAKAHDERAAKIVSQAQAAGLQSFLILGIVAVIVAGYFNTTVSVTILACIFAAAVITLGCKIYYRCKY